MVHPIIFYLYLTPIISPILSVFSCFQFYEKLAQRIEEQRNRHEEERERELMKNMMKEKGMYTSLCSMHVLQCLNFDIFLKGIGLKTLTCT